MTTADLRRHVHIFILRRGRGIRRLLGSFTRTSCLDARLPTTGAKERISTDTRTQEARYSRGTAVSAYHHPLVDA